MDTLTKEQRIKTMRAIKSSDTSIEVLLRKSLWAEGIRYRKNYKKILGSPDIVITKYKIAIFCDGVFWHGKNFNEKSFGTNSKYWINKIKRNKEHDLETTIALRDSGWIVLRFWESEIKKNINFCIEEVIKAINFRISQSKLNTETKKHN